MTTPLTAAVAKSRKRLIPVLLGVALVVVAAAPALADSSDFDASFGFNGVSVTPASPGFVKDEINDIILQSDGKIVAAGWGYRGSLNQQDFVVARYLPDGSIDPTFAAGSFQRTSFSSTLNQATAVGLLVDGGTVAGGWSGQGFGHQADFALAGYLDNGFLNPDFGDEGRVVTDFAGLADYGMAMIVSGGKIVLAGRSARSGGRWDMSVARYNLDGSPDTSFSLDGRTVVAIGSRDSMGYAVDVQPDGKTIVAGKIKAAGGGYHFVVTRLLADGSLDPGFGSGGVAESDIGGRDSQVLDVMVLSDGAIIAVGSANMGTGRRIDFAAARYTSAGLLDSSFGTGGTTTVDFSGYNEMANDVEKQLDGSLVLGGWTDRFGTKDMGFARLNADGSLDTTFGPTGWFSSDASTGDDVVNGLELQPDGQILTGGYVFKTATANDFALARFTGGSDPACDITGTEGDDIIEGTEQSESICGLGGNDTIRGYGGKDTIYGGSGNDRLYGNSVDDRLFGEAGSDTLDGGSGDDTLDGGPDSDQGIPGSGLSNIRNCES